MGKRGAWTGLLCTAAALVAVQAGSANRLRVNAADQATAKRGVLKLADLPAITSWQEQRTSGGAHGAAGSALSCKGYNPKSADLVTTGEATSQFSAPGAEIQNEVTLLSTPRMVEVDWRRSIVGALVPCLKEAFTRGGGGKLHVLSLARVPFPNVAPHAAAYRLVYGLNQNGRPLQGAADFIVLAGGRVEITFFLVANLGTKAQARTAQLGMTLVERQLAQTVAGRLLAPLA